MNNKLIIVGFLMLLILGCSKNTNEVIVSSDDGAFIVDSTMLDTHSTRTAVNWFGTYNGTLPCANCPGIETSITLFSDNSYKLKTLYLESNDAQDVEQGIFKWDKSENIIQLNNREKTQYKVGENQIWMLDKSGNMIEGDLAKNYVLLKE